MSHDAYIEIRICKNCYVSIVRPHPELSDLEWFKCPTCGWCVQLKKVKYESRAFK